MFFYSTPQDPSPDGSFLLPVCTTRERLQKILSVLHFGIFEAGYLDDVEAIFDILEAMAWTRDPQNAPCVSALLDDIPRTRDGVNSALAWLDCDDFIGDDCEDNMSCLKPVLRGGSWYLPVDCGCNETLFLPLGAPAELDADGNPIAGTGGDGQASGSGDFGAWDWGNVSDPAACYADGATSYLLNRAIQYAHAVIDFASVGLDALSALDEYVEVAAVVSKILFGTEDIPAIQALTKSAVASALTDSATTTPLSDNWTYDGKVTKAQLGAWIKNAPAIVAGVPVRIILQQWLIDSWLIGISKDLARIASECESGNYVPTLPEFSDYDWVYLYDFTLDDYDWVGGRSPEENSWGNWESGLGWGNAAGGTVHMHVSCTLREELTITGMRITLNNALPASGYNLYILDDIDGTNKAQDLAVGSTNQFDLAVNDTLQRPQVWLWREDNAANTYYITQVLMFGTGDEPTVGVKIG